jgi:tubby-related protein 1
MSFENEVVDFNQNKNKEGWAVAKKRPQPKGPAPVNITTNVVKNATNIQSVENDNDKDSPEEKKHKEINDFIESDSDSEVDDDIIDVRKQNMNDYDDLSDSSDLDVVKHEPIISVFKTSNDKTFEEYSKEAASNGIVLPRKSANYDDVDEDKNDKNVKVLPNQTNKLIPFVLKAHIAGRSTEHVQCTIIRYRSSLFGRSYPTYELVLDDSKKLLIIARKMNMNRTSNYHLFDMTRGSAGDKLTKKSGNYLGKLRAKDVTRTCYSLLNNCQEKEELAAVHFDRLNLVEQLKEGSQPRKLTVVIPNLDSDNVPIPNKLIFNSSDGTTGNSLTDHFVSSKKKTDNYSVYESKDPSYENGHYRLNFKGRVSVASVKNFQLINTDEPNDVICQFGKIGEDKFHLDFKAPFNAVQAFAVALCEFNL